MRLLHLIKAEFFFLWKQGIVSLYVIFTLIYLFLLMLLPESIRETATIILVLTDPAAMGLYFMGAVVLLEKSQRIHHSLAVSPLKTGEYIGAKIIAFVILGVVVGVILFLYSGAKNFPLILCGIILASALFSCLGLYFASKAGTLNRFVIDTIPVEIVVFVPAILYLFDVIHSDWWILNPGVAAVKLISGDSSFWVFSMLSLIVWASVTFYFCQKAVARLFSEMKGGKI